MTESSNPRRVGMGLLFYPRGGSAQVVRYLSSALAEWGWRTDLATGSLGDPGASTNAAPFFGCGDLVVGDHAEATGLSVNVECEALSLEIVE